MACIVQVGAGSGGRLSVLDALELPTTYGIEKGRVEVVLAGTLEDVIPVAIPGD